MTLDYLRSAAHPPSELFGPRPERWRILGPGGGGCLHVLTVNPHRPDTLLVACDMTAGYISHDRGGSWRSFNLKSRFYAFAFDASKPDVVYAGSSGLFRSENNGLTWRLIFPSPCAVIGETRCGDEANHTYLSTDNWPGGTVCAIWADGERLLIGVKHRVLQLFESVDRGATWQERGSPAGSDLHLLLPDAVNGAPGLLAFTDHGVFRLLAGSATWSRCALPEPIRALRAATWGVDPAAGVACYFVTALEGLPSGHLTTAVYCTSSRTDVWTRCSDGLKTLDAEGRDVPCAFSQVSACRRDARSVYLIAEQYPERTEAGEWVMRHGVLRSADAGASWEWVVKMDDGADPVNREFGWAERDYGAQWGDIAGEHQISPKGRFAWDVAASPVDAQTCYTMDFSTLYETRDGGATWQQLVTHLLADGSAVSRGIDVLSAYTVAFDPFDPTHIALPMTDVGIFHSYDRGRTWRHSLKGVPRAWINTCYGIVFDPDVPGKAWAAWAAMHDLPRAKMHRDELFARDEGGVCRSDDGLGLWRVSNRGMPKHTLPTHIVLDPLSPPGARTLYVAAMMGGVYRSSDDGQSWQEMNEGLPAHPAAWRLALLPGGELYLVTVYDHSPAKERAGGLWRWQPARGCWQPVNLPPLVLDPNDLTFDPNGRLYLACWPAPPGPDERGGGVFASTDGGATWEQIFDDSAHAYTVSIDPRDPARLFLATFDAALLLSEDGGARWKPVAGYDFQWCRRAVVDAHAPGMIYVATFGNSVWHGPI